MRILFAAIEIVAVSGMAYDFSDALDCTGPAFGEINERGENIWDFVHESIVRVLSPQFLELDEEAQIGYLQNDVLDYFHWVQPSERTRQVLWLMARGGAESRHLDEQCYLGGANLLALRCIFEQFEGDDQGLIVNISSKIESGDLPWSFGKFKPVHPVLNCLESTVAYLSPPRVVDLTLGGRWPIKITNLLRAAEAYFGIGRLWERNAQKENYPRNFDQINDKRLKMFAILSWAVHAPYHAPEQFAIDAAFDFSIPTVPFSRLSLDRSQSHLRQENTWCSAPKVVVIGSHMGSNMEPASLITNVYREDCPHAESIMKPSVLGTIYPNGDMMCDIFGHCHENYEIKQAIQFFVKHMYEPNWDLSQVRALLQTASQEDPRISDADLIICAQPMPICAVLRALVQTPFLLYMAFPLLGATPDDARGFLHLTFNEMIRNPSRNIFVVYNVLLGQQIEALTGVSPLLAWPMSMYTLPHLYNPTINVDDRDREVRKVVVARNAGWSHDESQMILMAVNHYAEKADVPFQFTFMGVNGLEEGVLSHVQGQSWVYSFDELPQYSIGIHIPWDFGMLFFSEMYNVGLPMFIPSRDWMSLLVWRLLRLGDFGFWQGRTTGVPVGWEGNLYNVTGTEQMRWPWIDSNSSYSNDIMTIYNTCDFETWPGVTFFSSIPDLMVKLMEFDFESNQIHHRMRKWTIKQTARSKEVFREALRNLGVGQGDDVLYS